MNWESLSRQNNFGCWDFFVVVNVGESIPAQGYKPYGKHAFLGRVFSLLDDSYFFAAVGDVSVLYSEDVVELLLLRLAEWLRLPPLLLCRPLCSCAGSP